MYLHWILALATLVHSSPAPPSPEIATNSTLNESPDKSGNQTTIDTASKDDDGQGIILGEAHAQTDTVNNSTVQPVSEKDSAVEEKVTDDPTTELPTDTNEDKAQTTDKAVNDQQPVENSDSEQDATEKSDSQQDEKEDEVPPSEETTKPATTTTTEVNTDDEPEVEQPDAKPEPTTTTTTETPVTEKVDNSEDEKSNSEEADTPIEPKEDPSDAQPSNPNYDERTSNALAVSCFGCRFYCNQVLDSKLILGLLSSIADICLCDIPDEAKNRAPDNC